MISTQHSKSYLYLGSRLSDLKASLTCPPPGRWPRQTIHAIDVFVVEEGRIRSLTYYTADIP
jgi:hypothetical protein